MLFWSVSTYQLQNLNWEISIISPYLLSVDVYETWRVLVETILGFVSRRWAIKLHEHFSFHSLDRLYIIKQFCLIQLHIAHLGWVVFFKHSFLYSIKSLRFDALKTLWLIILINACFVWNNDEYFILQTLFSLLFLAYFCNSNLHLACFYFSRIYFINSFHFPETQ